MSRPISSDDSDRTHRIVHTPTLDWLCKRVTDSDPQEALSDKMQCALSCAALKVWGDMTGLEMPKSEKEYEQMEFYRYLMVIGAALQSDVDDGRLW